MVLMRKSIIIVNLCFTLSTVAIFGLFTYLITLVSCVLSDVLAASVNSQYLSVNGVGYGLEDFLREFDNGDVVIILFFSSVLLALFIFRRLLVGEYGLGEESLTVTEAIAVVVLTWFLSPVIAMVPFIVKAGMSPLDSFFEAVSGLTGTGLTMITDIESKPLYIKAWRGVMQWYGELGIVVVSIALFAKRGSPLYRLYAAEGREERIEAGVKRTLRLVLRTYILYTAIGTVAYIALGMTPLDALVHSMTGIATGGFADWSESIGFYRRVLPPPNYWGVYIVTIVIMILGAINFRDHDKLLRGRVREFFSPETKALLTLLAVFSALTVVAYLKEGYPLDKAVEEGVFHLISAMTTTGFQVGDLSSRSDLTKVIITLSMIIGGSTFATTGGIKVYRILIIKEATLREIRSLVKPRSTIIVARIGKEKLSDDVIIRTYVFAFLYIVILLISAAALTGIGNYRFVDALFEVASAQGCTGLSVGVTSPNMPAACKVILIANMILGKLEILPVLTFFYTVFKEIKRKVMRSL